MHTNRLLVPTPSTNPTSGENQSDRHIAFTEWGDPDNPHVIICIHGLTRNCRDFDFFAQAMQADCRIFCVDIVGRGQSDWLNHAHDYENNQIYLSDAITLMTHIRNQTSSEKIKLDWIGISLGGLIGMLLATQSALPIPINRLVISDIGPLVPITAMRRMADYVGKDPRFKTFAEFDTYIRQIARSFGSFTEAQWQHLAQHSMRKYPDGTVGFRYDPRISISFKDKRLQQDVDLWEYWDRVHIPTLVLRGIESDVLSVDTAKKMQQRGPKATIVELPGIGHAPILFDQKQITIVKNFLLADE